MGEMRPPRRPRDGGGSMTGTEFHDGVATAGMWLAQVCLISLAIMSAVALVCWLIVIAMEAGRMIRDGEWGGWRK